MSFFDFNVLPLFWHHLTAFQLAPEAVDESWPNGFLPARGLPPDLPVSNLRRSIPGQSLRQGLRSLHIAAGAAALLLFWIPVAAPKGGRLHIHIGWTYVVCMSVVVLTAFSMSGMAFLDPLGVRRFAQPLPVEEVARFVTASRVFAVFLAYLAGVTLVSGWQGVWALRTRRDPPVASQTLRCGTERPGRALRAGHSRAWHPSRQHPIGWPEPDRTVYCSREPALYPERAAQPDGLVV